MPIYRHSSKTHLQALRSKCAFPFFAPKNRSIFTDALRRLLESISNFCVDAPNGAFEICQPSAEGWKYIGLAGR
jgi:hypothetical protein